MPWKEYGVVEQRYEFVIRCLSKQESFTELCSEYGITPKTGYKWKSRFLKEGLDGLADQSRRPKSNSKQLAESVTCEIIRIKNAKKKWGPKKIRDVYASIHKGKALPSLSTFERVLKKSGMVESRKRNRTKKSSRITNRVKADVPNKVWTVDFKGWWYTPEKERCEPLTIRDEFSKFILDIRILEKGDILRVQRVFEQIFLKYGVPEYIRSDNGPPFASSRSVLGLTRLSVWWMAQGILLDRIKPASPHENGGHERMHLDMKRELEGKIKGNLKFHQSIFDTWRDEFNYERPHESLGMKKPAAVYRKSKRKFQRFDRIEYPEQLHARHVSTRGYINYKGRHVFISNAFNGFDVGIHDTGKSKLPVYFCEHCIGFVDLDSYTFIEKSG